MVRELCQDVFMVCVLWRVLHILWRDVAVFQTSFPYTALVFLRRRQTAMATAWRVLPGGGSISSFFNRE
jgi:hypothetical protein